MICSNCGKEMSDTLGKCPCCGNDLKGMQAESTAESTMKRFCAECGAPLQDNAMFCMKCGTKSKLKPVKTEILNAASQNVQSQLRSQSSPKTAKTKSGTQRNGIVIAVVSIIVLVIAFSMAQTCVVENVEENAQNEEQKTPKTIQLDSSYIRSIQASSELTDSTKTYQAEFVFDGNRETCWCEGQMAREREKRL